MKLVVFGASGRLGSRIVEGLLERDYSVRAFIHVNNLLPQHERLELIRGDVHNKDHVSDAIAGVDVVVASLGSAGARVQDISSSGMGNIVPAVKRYKVKRIVSVTGSAAYDQGEADAPHPHLRTRHELMQENAPGLLADGEKHLAILRASDLDWTVVRAPIMRDELPTLYTLVSDPPPPQTTIAYRAVARAMIDLTELNTWYQRAPFIR